jgi:hypothetical protein
LVERRLAKAKVAGSNPVFRSKFRGPGAGRRRPGPFATMMAADGTSLTSGSPRSRCSLAFGEIIASNDYYELTLTVDPVGKMLRQTQTEWVGFTDDVPRREIRGPSLVIPDRMAEIWSTAGEPFCIVNTRHELAVFLSVIGGHSLIEKRLAERFFQRLIQPVVSVPRSPFGGYSSARDVPAGSLRHVPTPKLRMSILKRDDLRCKICGRNPDNHLDLELHVHHIRPWADSGLTEAWNLITLCSTCHKGLHPHYEYALYSKVKGGALVPDFEDGQRAYIEGVERFRAAGGYFRINARRTRHEGKR